MAETIEARPVKTPQLDEACDIADSQQSNIAHYEACEDAEFDMDALEVYEDAHIPAEFLCDDTAITNVVYLRRLEEFNRLIVAQERGMRSGHVKVCQYYFQSKQRLTHGQIGEKTGYSAASVGTILRSDPVRQLLSLYAYRNTLNALPSRAIRGQLLFEIALENKQSSPRIAIEAIKAINDMDAPPPTPISAPSDNSTRIIIDQRAFPRTALDG